MGHLSVLLILPGKAPQHYLELRSSGYLYSNNFRHSFLIFVPIVHGAAAETNANHSKYFNIFKNRKLGINFA
jgi:hypothetical protein